jgi:hypothetical protein
LGIARSITRELIIDIEQVSTHKPTVNNPVEKETFRERANAESVAANGKAAINARSVGVGQ